MSLKELLKKKAKMGKRMSPEHMKAMDSVASQLENLADGTSGEALKSVTVASNTDEGLAEGLDIAEEVTDGDEDTTTDPETEALMAEKIEEDVNKENPNIEDYEDSDLETMDMESDESSYDDKEYDNLEIDSEEATESGDASRESDELEQSNDDFSEETDYEEEGYMAGLSDEEKRKLSTLLGGKYS